MGRPQGSAVAVLCPVLLVTLSFSLSCCASWELFPALCPLACNRSAFCSSEAWSVPRGHRTVLGHDQQEQLHPYHVLRLGLVTAGDLPQDAIYTACSQGAWRGHQAGLLRWPWAGGGHRSSTMVASHFPLSSLLLWGPARAPSHSQQPLWAGPAPGPGGIRVTWGTLCICSYWNRLRWTRAVDRGILGLVLTVTEEPKVSPRCREPCVPRKLEQQTWSLRGLPTHPRCAQCASQPQNLGTGLVWKQRHHGCGWLG